MCILLRLFSAAVCRVKDVYTSSAYYYQLSAVVCWIIVYTCVNVFLIIV